MKKTQKWGLPIPNEVLESKGQPRAYWGARAIYAPKRKNLIELIYDQQTLEPEETLYPILLDWANEKGIPWLKEQLKIAKFEKNFRYDAGMFGLIGQHHRGHINIGVWRHDTSDSQYELATPDPNAKWTGSFPIPSPGERVNVIMNQFGTATVIDYSVKSGYLGLRVKPDRLPDWFLKQNPFTSTGTFYGVELRPIKN